MARVTHPTPVEIYAEIMAALADDKGEPPIPARTFGLVKRAISAANRKHDQEAA